MQPRHVFPALFAIAILAISAGPAAAYWQFTAYSPSGDRKVHGPYSSRNTCEAMIKRIDAQLAKQYPNLYPRVGSCQEFK